VWKYTQKFVELEKGKWDADHKDEKEKKTYNLGSDLDEVLARKVLESFGETLTAISFREKMKHLDLDGNHRIGVLEFCLYKFKGDVKDLLAEKRLVNQGVPQELTDAQKAFEEARGELEKVEAKKAQLTAESEGTGVKANAAKAALAQYLQEDHMELNKALASAEAKVRAAQKLQGPQPRGGIWWVSREAQEAAKYRPKGK